MKERRKDMIQSCDTLGKLSNVVGSGFEKDDLLNHLRNSRPTVKDEFLLDNTSNSSLDSIEERLQTSLLGTKWASDEEFESKTVGKLVHKRSETIGEEEVTC